MGGLTAPVPSRGHRHSTGTGIEMIGDTVQMRVDALRDADSPRAKGVDVDHVRTLAEAGGKLPPIIVHRATMRVIDGMHRLTVARLEGRIEVGVRFFDGTEDEAFL